MIATSLVAAATAEEYYWTKNNNFGSMSNWAVGGVACGGADQPKGCPGKDQEGLMTFAGPMNIPDASACSGDNKWQAEKGRVVKMEADSVSLSTRSRPAHIFSFFFSFFFLPLLFF